MINSEVFALLLSSSKLIVSFRDIKESISTFFTDSKFSNTQKVNRWAFKWWHCVLGSISSFSLAVEELSIRDRLTKPGLPFSFLSVLSKWYQRMWFCWKRFNHVITEEGHRRKTGFRTLWEKGHWILKTKWGTIEARRATYCSRLMEAWLVKFCR